MQRQIFAAAVLCALCACVSAKKYVLHVVADDLGYDDVGWRNGQAQTPTLDGLVKNGREIK